MLSPIIRQKKLAIVTFCLSLLIFGGIQALIPAMSRTIVYFSVKPMAHTQNSALDDPADSAEKVADTLAGWAKDPAFRAEILKNGDFYIDNLKKKLTARKQNRMNVFWTTTLYEEERALEQKMADSLIKTITQNIADYNTENPYPINISTPRVSHQIYAIPATWYWVGAVMLSLFFAGMLPIIIETANQKVSHISQIEALAKDTPILHISQKLGKHDQLLLDQYLSTFESPRLIGTFAKADKYFSLAARDSVSEIRDTPVLLVKIGETTLTEIKNLQAIFEKVAFIVFHK
ncbi:hypothetical protein CSB37_00470 [bacterium DOLZORAL124_38_8]|nr:MAG: hypothetical protein CSB37_00470 [bacterium DOLZORAL124_38_8]